ncbi:hypothetical protein [Streptomyces lydicus]|nr:hypothetical protein [Streptomyces lydicus]MCZ1011359.1 hypothetical protein [Streptomyces lydicus]
MPVSFLDGVREQASGLVEQSMQEPDRVSQCAAPAWYVRRFGP